MKYALMIWHGEEHSEPPEEIDEWPDHKAWMDDLVARGVFKGGARLRPTATTKVRVRDGETLVSDGPYAETKELIGGFCIIECCASGRGDRDRGGPPVRGVRHGRGPAGLGL